MFRQVLLEIWEKLHEKDRVHHLVQLGDLLARIVELEKDGVLVIEITKGGVSGRDGEDGGFAA